MSKFDVNKIISQSLEIVTEVSPANAWDKWSKTVDMGFAPKEEPDSPAFQTAKKLAAARGKDPVEAAKLGRQLRAMMATPEQKKAEAENFARMEKEAKDLEDAKKANTDSFQGKTAADERAKELLAKQKEEVDPESKTVLGHIGKSFEKIKKEAEEGATSFGHKVADHLANLDYGKTALAAGGALAAGLGALALRKRLRKM